MKELKHFQTFTKFSERAKALSEEAKLLELSNAQQEYADFFLATLKEYGVKSPSELDDAKKAEFFSKIEKGWTKEESEEAPVNTEAVSESSEEQIEEAEINSDEEFKEFAEAFLKAAYKDEYDEAKAKSTIDGMLADKGDKSYGELAGMLQNG